MAISVTKDPPASASVPSGKVVTSSPDLKLSPIHDAAQQARFLRQILEDNKLRVGCLFGAGCPLGIYGDKGESSLVLIPAISELTERVAVGLDGSDKKAWEMLCNECKETDCPKPSVEDVLTELRTLANRRGKAEVMGLTKERLNELDTKVCSLIVKEMSKSLPSHRSSYNRFASWLGGRQSIFPVEIFTPNYDLLFEQAFEQHPLPHFDGFVGSREPWFDLASIEHDNLPGRWTRLWKLHGSINWEKIEDASNGTSVIRIVRVARSAYEGKALIHPSHLKYDQSRRMPYLAMLDRFRAFFRGRTGRSEDGPRLDEKIQDAPRMIVCGYSFLDDHLNEILLDGLRGNHNAQCFALMYSKLSDYPRLTSYAEKQANITVLARDGAIVGTRIGLYRPGTSGGEEHSPWLTEEEVKSKGDPGKSEKQVQSRLGDFHYFGLFLEELCGGGENNVS